MSEHNVMLFLLRVAEQDRTFPLPRERFDTRETSPHAPRESSTPGTGMEAARNKIQVHQPHFRKLLPTNRPEATAAVRVVTVMNQDVQGVRRR